MSLLIHGDSDVFQVLEGGKCSLTVKADVGIEHCLYIIVHCTVGNALGWADAPLVG